MTVNVKHVLVQRWGDNLLPLADNDELSPPPVKAVVNLHVSPLVIFDDSGVNVAGASSRFPRKHKGRQPGSQAARQASDLIGIMYEMSQSRRQGVLTLSCASFDRDQCT
ncbi:hypothetical protein NQZ68_029534 [Dissostichus eleginoides]|nr:hypothetical protein NQZ68_029534 [Dissostichus eleginoides]